MEHTADFGVLAKGDTLADVFVQAALGMFSFILAEPEKVQEREVREVEVTAPDREVLLVNWLNELVYLLEVEGMLFRRFEIVEMDGRHLRARCYGEKIDPARHRLKIGVKSATYHMLQVRKRKDGWHARVILDI
jgi:SHS2 domain-containing protein